MATAPSITSDTQTLGANPEVKPLSERELRLLDSLLARAAALQSPHAPAIQVGEPYVALVNLSVPRRSNNYSDPKGAREVDRVMRGETVYLTDAEAALFMRHDPDRDGRQIPVIRKLHGPDSSETRPLIIPRLLSGRQFGPPVNARRDPPGSSFVQEMAPAIPESAPPQPGSEMVPRQDGPDAQDIPPRGAAAEALGSPMDAARAAVAGADPEMVARVRANMPGKS